MSAGRLLAVAIIVGAGWSTIACSSTASTDASPGPLTSTPGGGPSTDDRPDTGEATAAADVESRPGEEPEDAPSTGAAAARDDADGPGVLVDATAEYGIGPGLLGVRGHAVAAADVNGDGWVDLFVGTFADRPIESYRVGGAEGPAPDRLLLGSADGFAIDEGFAGRFGRTAGAAFADLDLDGDVDLVVSRNVRDGERRDAPSEIYRNDAGKLVPATELDRSRGGRAIGVVDIDSDGLLDLVLVEDRWSGGSTGLFRNDGGLRFTEVTDELGFPGDVWGLGVAVGDLDGDGRPDLVVGGSNRWFLGDGRTFSEGSGSPLPWSTNGDEDDPAHVVLSDVDGDGATDILIGQHFNSTVDAGLPQPVRLFRHVGQGPDGQPRFADRSAEVGLLPLPTKSPQILLLDLEGDGLPDLVTTSSVLDGDQHRPLVFRRDGETGGPTFELSGVDLDRDVDAHYWIDAVVLDANGDGRDDVFMVEWEPSVGSRLFLNLPVQDQ